MKLNSKVLLAVVTVAASGFGFATSAFAHSIGVGGVAGSASFQLNGTQVESAAVSAAVGKDTAYAGANVSPFSSTVGTSAIKTIGYLVLVELVILTQTKITLVKFKQISPAEFL